MVTIRVLARIKFKRPKKLTRRLGEIFLVKEMRVMRTTVDLEIIILPVLQIAEVVKCCTFKGIGYKSNLRYLFCKLHTFFCFNPFRVKVRVSESLKIQGYYLL
jgi:hypothetical protein